MELGTAASNALGRHSASAQLGLLDLHKRAINKIITCLAIRHAEYVT